MALRNTGVHVIACLKLARTLPNFSHRHGPIDAMKNEVDTEAAPPAPAEPAPELVWTELFDRLQLNPLAESDDVRLRRIRTAIARGQFHVNAHAIADRLIARLVLP